MKARDSQEGLDRATDELAAHRWMAVLDRLDRLGLRVQAETRRCRQNSPQRL